MSPQPPPRPPGPSQQYRDKRTYIPPQVERAIANQMQHTLPAHMRQYADAYVQQRMGHPGASGMNAMPQSSQFQPHAPLFHAPRQTESYRRQPEPPPGAQVPGQLVQPSVVTAGAAAEPSAAAPETQPPPGQLVQPAPAADKPPDAYDFITHPKPLAPKRLTLPGASSLPIRIAFITGSLLVLVILFSVVKGLLTGPSHLTPFIGIAQDQQELIHLADNAAKQHIISNINQNFAATAQLTLGSSQSAIIKYLARSGQKIDAKNLALNSKVSSKVDAQLTAAAAATTYDQVFQQIMQADMKVYISDLKQAFALKTTNAQGRFLLNQAYTGAQLLLIQLNEPTQ